MHLFSKILLSHPTGCAIIKNCLRRKKPAFCTGAKDRMIKLKVKLLVQIGIVFGICLVGEGIAAILPFAFPASVLSMLLRCAQGGTYPGKGRFPAEKHGILLYPIGCSAVGAGRFSQRENHDSAADLSDYDGADLCCHRFYRAAGQPLAEASEKGGMLNGCRFFFPAVWNCSVHLYL